MNDTKASLDTEIATRKKAEYSLYGLMQHLPNPDPVLKKLGKDITVYRDLLADPQVGGNTRRRRSAVLSLEQELEQGDSSDAVYELCQTVLERIKLPKLISGLHNACWYGYSPAEVMWEAVNGQWLPYEVVVKPPEWFAFDDDNRLCFLEAGRIVGEPVPQNKFILATQDATYANPYGMGDLSKVYWAVTFKKGGLKFWLRFCDKYGQAFVIGKHPRGTNKPEKNELLDSLENLIQDAVAVIPDDGSIEILESGGKSASADLFERLLSYCKGDINTAILGQNQSTEMSATHASAKAGNEVVDDIRDGDADFVIAPAINALLDMVVRLNIGENEAMPVWRMYELEDKTKEYAERDEKLAKAGAIFSKQHFVNTYDLDDDQLKDAVPENAGSAPTSFSEFTPVTLDYTDETEAQLAKRSAPSVFQWITHINSLLANAASLEDFQEQLTLSFGYLNSDDLSKVMELAFTAAELAGMAEVAEEVANDQ